MQSASSSRASHQLPSTSVAESALSSSSVQHHGGQGGGNAPPPSSPRFNLPDSFWSQPHAQWRAERPTAQADGVWLQVHAVEFLARRQAASIPTAAEISKRMEGSQQDQENDPRSRIQGLASRINMTPLRLADYELSAESYAGLIVLIKDPDSPQSQPQSSTAATATALQQDSDSACCLPPPCTIL
jgi:hypothetical protein